MATSHHSMSCQCGNSISYNDYHEAGGINDKYVVVYKCEKCERLGHTIVENDSRPNLAGATVLNSTDRESIQDLKGFLSEKGIS